MILNIYIHSLKRANIVRYFLLTMIVNYIICLIIDIHKLNKKKVPAVKLETIPMLFMLFY
jgi:hypothetical protein